MWWIVHIEGGPRRVNHAAVAVGEFNGQEDLDLLGLLNLNDSGRFCLRGSNLLLRRLLHGGQLQNEDAHRPIHPEPAHLSLEGGAEAADRLCGGGRLAVPEIRAHGKLGLFLYSSTFSL